MSFKGFLMLNATNFTLPQMTSPFS